MTNPSEEPGGSVAAVLLAAGAGSRFGGERGSKLLADFRGEPVISHAMEYLAESPVGEVFVVVADVSGGAAKLARGFGFRVVENAAAADGQATSVLAGLRAVREAEEFGGMLVALGDQPLVGRSVVERLVGAYRDGAEVAVATYFGGRRNPVLFSRLAWYGLESALSGDEGARGFLRGKRDSIVEVECGDVGSAVDVDTREDLAGLEAEVRGIS